MRDTRDNQDDSTEKQDTKLPHLKDSLTRENLLEFGKKGMTPFLDILHRYRDDVMPFVDSIKIGCEAATRELGSRGTDSAHKIVGQWFNEIGSFVDESRQKLQEEDSRGLFEFVKEKSQKRPALMFSTSYLLGLFAGRLSKKQLSTDHAKKLH